MGLSLWLSSSKQLGKLLGITPALYMPMFAEGCLELNSDNEQYTLVLPWLFMHAGTQGIIDDEARED